jgi:hypothetical protein
MNEIFLPIYISVNRWTIKEKESKGKRTVTEENIEIMWFIFHGNDFSFGGDVDNCGK